MALAITGRGEQTYGDRANGAAKLDLGYLAETARRCTCVLPICMSRRGRRDRRLYTGQSCLKRGLLRVVW